jgi:glycogen(starch) synthase
MRILMLGWEFPPAIVGGLGTACYGLTRGLAAEGAEVAFVLPHVAAGVAAAHVRLLAADAPLAAIRTAAEQGRSAPSADLPRAYESPSSYTARLFGVSAASTPAGTSAGTCAAPAIGDGFFEAVDRYAAGVERLARAEAFDLIHAHDWMTYPAGVRARAAADRPLVCHVHSTEFDRAGECGDRCIAEIERQGLEAADEIIAVSAYTRGVVAQRYGLDRRRIAVVHNAIDPETVPPAPWDAIKPWNRVVVFVGRLAFQKGPDYFVEAAARVLEVMPNVKFVLAGEGGMLPQLAHRIAALRRGKDILFAGFLDRSAVGRLLRMADLYVMTSVSEPFGIAALEAMAHGVPVIIPRTAGVSEAVANALRVDFWDVQKLADRMLAVLRHAPLQRTLSRLGREEVGRLSWRTSARQCLDVYRHALAAPRRHVTDETRTAGGL